MKIVKLNRRFNVWEYGYHIAIKIDLPKFHDLETHNKIWGIKKILEELYGIDWSGNRYYPGPNFGQHPFSSFETKTPKGFFRGAHYFAVKDESILTLALLKFSSTHSLQGV